MSNSRSLNCLLPNLASLILCLLAACSQEAAPVASSVAIGTSDTDAGEIAYEEFTLDNGLQVILHIDRSDPVVAVVLTAHVGSARELPGRTGFAHLFEHLLFLESENLGKGGLDAMSARIGGSGANGSTNRDRTNYLQTVPKDALEKMLWAEADKLGWFINTVTEPVLAKEKQVVKNEKRQSYDNQPYGHTSEVITAALYPAGHPYSWEVIGSLDDIQNATIEDVRNFYRRWYTPNNVTLTIAGDFDPGQARAWVERYFAEIPRGEDVTPLPDQPADLQTTRSYFHEDRFAQLPELTIVWPTVPQYHTDSAPLQVLMGLLAKGKEAPLNEVLVDEQQFTASVDLFHRESELAGELYLAVRAFDGVDLDTVAAAIDAAFLRFENAGIAAEDLQRIKTGLEVDYFNSVATVLGKAVNLGATAAIHGDPALLNAELDALRAVRAEDVMQVYESYLKDRPHIETSFVPAGQVPLALAGSTRADIFEEAIIAGAEESFDVSLTAEYERTPSVFDRSVEPPYGPAPALNPPAIGESTLDNGIQLAVISDNELPLVQFELEIGGGMLLEDPAKGGTANFLAEILDKGTVSRTPAEFENALAALGSKISVRADAESFSISGSTLARNFSATMALVREMLLQPRFDESEISLARARIISALQDDLASPTALADRLLARVMWGEQHPFARDPRGTPDSVAAITTADLQAWHATALAPALASIRLVGAIDLEDAAQALSPFNAWSTPALQIPGPAPAQTPEVATVYFLDMPGAAQSVFRFGHPGPLRNDPDYFAVQMLNYRLGGGGFASQLTQELRESKGYTYGINSRFNASLRQGEFRLGTSVRSNVTLEALELIRSMLSDYGPGFNEQDLETSRSYLLKSQARAFESLNAKLDMLGDVLDYGLPHDYLLQQRQLIENMTVEDLRRLASDWLHPEAMHYVIVGDAATQLPGLLKEDMNIRVVTMTNP